MMAEIQRPPPKRTATEWADENRVLPPGSAEPGPWRSARTPYTGPIAEACADPRYKRVVVVMGSQMGKTASLLNIIGHKLDDDPAPVLYIGPTKSNVDGVIEPQVAQMLRSARSLWRKTLTGRKAQKLIKRVSGVTLRLAWAGSPTELASQPAHTVLVDEVDRMAPIPGEGDPVSLAEARIATYPDGRLIITSTPTEGNVSPVKHPETGIEHWEVAQPEDLQSPVWRLWQEGTRWELAAPCPECKTYFVPRFKLLQWPEGCTPKRALKEARLACPSCGALINDEHRSRMIAASRYIAPGQRIEGDQVVGDPPDTDTASFWASGLMSPWMTWGQRAAAWIRAARSGDQERTRTAINTAFGELYRIGADAPPWESVRELRGAYQSGMVPSGVRALTCGVDVQKNRVVYSVRGWGLRAESWLIECGDLWGETDQEAVWSALEELLERPFDGKRIRRMAVDSGYRPGDKWKRPDHMVYAFARKHQGRVIATKGHETQSKPLSPSMIDVTIGGRLLKKGLQLWHLDADYFKSWVHSRLQWPVNQPGAWHVPDDVTDDYCQQVTAEARVPKPSGRVAWVRIRRENHLLDCEALNVAAAHSLGIHRLREKIAPAEETEPQDSQVLHVEQPTATRPAQRRRGGWINGWR
jgi:phage terminase large subunit GpA-like protein